MLMIRNKILTMSMSDFNFLFVAYLTVRIVISLFQFSCCLLDCEDGGNHNDRKQKNGDENGQENH